MDMMKSNRTRTVFIALDLVLCCLIGLPNLYDKFLISRFVATTISLAIVFLFALVGKKRWVIPNTPVFYIYLLFTLLCGCSILWATNTAEAVFAFSTQLLTLLVIIVFYSLLEAESHSTQKALWISAAIILVVYLFFAVTQLFQVESFSFEQLYQVSGINGHKNLLAIMLFVLSAFLLTSFSIFESKTLKWLSVLLFVIAITVIILLKSRAVLLSTLVAVIFFGVLLLMRSRHCEEVRRSNPDKPALRQAQGPILIISIVLVYAFFTLGLRWFADSSVPRTSEKSEIEHNVLSTSSLVERCLLWDKTYHIVDKHPVAGCGIGNWQIHFPDASLERLYRSDVWDVHFTKPHNEYLGVLSETGYFGLLLYIAFLTSIIVLSFFALRKIPSRKNFLFGGIVLSIFVGSCVNTLFDFPNSRIEHIIWMGIFMAILFHIITKDKQKALGKGWNVVFLLIAIMLVIIGGFRLNGERNTFKMQQALQVNDWKTMERCCHQAVSAYYTIDPMGLPLHWYLGKAEKTMGNPQAIESFRKAYRYAPYCKENLNDLGLVEYYTAHDPRKAESYLKEAIRISPNYIYPYLNLAYIYLSENEPQKAKAVADALYFDEHKREVMKADAVFFEPFNAEAVRQKIDAEYEATLSLHKTILDEMQK
ncbi:MAG: O-antigen ligase family protein [Bacteroidales bacterium]|nr:O-antigen ligase family protein [Bacteroidales bacterium]